METQLLWIIAAFGFTTLVGIFLKMKSGFGPFNLRVVGLVIVATFSTLLALTKTESLNAAMGILGAIAGYLFGIKDSLDKGKEKKEGVDIDSSQFGDYAKIAGRDINEKIENMQGDIAQIKDSVINQFSTIEKSLTNLDAQSWQMQDYLVNTIFERNPPKMVEAIGKVVNRWQQEGWRFRRITADYQVIDGIMLVFTKPCDRDRSKFLYYHGSQMESIKQI